MISRTLQLIGILMLMTAVVFVFLTIHHPETPSKANDFASTFHKSPISISKHIHFVKSYFSKIDEYTLAFIILISTILSNSLLLRRLKHIPLQIRGRFLMPIKLTSTSF